MGISFRFVGGERAGENVAFDDRQELIRLGRDAAECQVVFPPGLTTVGREHCLVRNESGKYRLEVPRDHRVYLDGVEIRRDVVLPKEGELQLGPGGPKLIVTVAGGPGLPPTAPQGRDEGTGTVIDRVGRSSRRGTLIACLSVVAVALVAFAGSKIADRLGRDVDDTKTGVATARDDATKARDEASKAQAGADQAQAAANETRVQLAQLTYDQAIRLQGLEAASLAASAPKPETEPEWKAIVEKVTPSVYLVLTRDADGVENTVATAWVVDRDRGLLATNAHVAEVIDEIASGDSLIARPTGEGGGEVVIDSVTMHPGSGDFYSLWDDYDPVLSTSADQFETVRNAGRACDVALMHVTDPSSLGPSIPLASAETLRSLAAGEPVAYVGFPMEGLVLGGVNPRRPAAKAQLGYVVAVTDYFGGVPSDPDQRLLIQHALAASGGASGSPILNRRGEAVGVFNAANVIGEIDGVRVSSGASIFFGQRADLVRELLDDTAAERQQVRTDAWKQEVAKYFQPRVQAERFSIVRGELESWTTNVEDEELADAVPRELGEGSVTIAQTSIFDTEGVAEWPFQVPGAGHYQVQAFSRDASAEMWVEVADADSGEILRYGFQFLAGWHDSAEFAVESGRRLVARVRGTPADATVDLKLYTAVLSPISPSEAVARRVERWKSDLTDARMEVPDAERILERSGTLSKSLDVYGDRFEVQIEQPGDYLIVAVPERDEALNLAAFLSGAEGGPPLAEDHRVSPVAFGNFRVEGSGKTEVYVSSTRPGAYRAEIYRADEPSGSPAAPAAFLPPYVSGVARR